MLSEKEFNVLLEGIESKMPHLVKVLTGKKSKWPDKDKDEEEIKEFIQSLTRFDPTGKDAAYLPYIVSQMAKDHLVLNMESQEDGERMFNTLKYFHDNKNKQSWPGEKDVFKYKNWRDLEDLVLKFTEEGKVFKSAKEIRKEKTKGAEVIYEVTIPNKAKTTYTFVELTEPEAVASYSMGTKWCTTNVETARSYLSSGPFYMIFRDGKGMENKGSMVGRSGQVLLTTSSGSDIMLHTDVKIGQISPALDYALAKWVESGTCPIPGVVNQKLRPLSPDYPQRPPL